ncbi:MAG: cyclase family protein [Chloroflexota bacterium]
MIQLYDISRTLNPQIAVWPGDAPFQISQTLSIAKNDSVNLTTITMSAHTGTHIDAPRHFLSDGAPVEQLDLSKYWGLAQVVTVSKESGPLFPDDFAGVDLTIAPRLLVHSRSSARNVTRFDDNIVYPSTVLADFLGAAGIVLYGADGPSMDKTDDPELRGHKALQRNEIAILEGVVLTGVPDGLYELVAMPLKIEGGDGTPVRAVLRTLAETE